MSLVDEMPKGDEAVLRRDRIILIWKTKVGDDMA